MKIIGYKLVKPEYGEAAMKIADGTSLEKWDSNLKNKGYMFTFYSDNKKLLEKAGILDLWFEPVYETPQIPKGSDAEKFVEMVGCKQKYTKDIVCGRITFSFDFLTTDRVDIHFDENGSFKRINTIS